MAKTLQIEITAKDSASNVIDAIPKKVAEVNSKLASEGGGGLFAKAKAANLESRKSGEAAFERILRGAGAAGLATFAIEGLGKALAGAGEAAEAYSKGEIKGSQATAQFIEKTVEGIPIIGGWVKSFGEMRDGVEDLASSLAKSVGASEKTVDLLKSETSRRKEAEEATKRQTEALKGLREATIDGSKFGVSEAAKSRIDEEEKYNKTLNDLQVKMNVAQKSHQDDRHIIIAAAQREIEQEKINHIARLKQIDDEANLAELNRLHQHQQAIVAAHGEINESALKNAGLEHAAENARAEREFQQQADAAEAKRAAETMKDPKNAAKFQREYEEDIAAAGDQKVAAQRNAHAKEVQQTVEFNAELSDMETKAAADRLRTAGRDDEARLLELRAQQQKELAALDVAQKAKDAQASLAGKGAGDAEYDRQHAMYEARRKAMVEANEAQTAEEQKQVDQRARDRTADASANVNRLLLENEIDQLKQAGELGDRNAEIEAKKVEYLQRQSEKRAEILKALRDENHVLSDAQKTALQNQLKSLELQTREGLLDINKPKRPDLASARGLAPELSEDTGGTSALAEQQAESLANQGGPNDKLADINAGIGDIAKAVDSGGWLADALQKLIAAATARTATPPLF